MSDLRTAAQQALEALEDHAKQYPHMQKGYTVDAITALRAALEQPEQEPVAILHRYPSKASLRVVYTDEITEVDEGSWPLYLHPPRRTWRGLTEEEVAKCWHDTPWNERMWFAFSRTIDAALRSKNHE